MKVTVGIPTYNSEKLIKNALDSLLIQTLPTSEFEVIVVDDCSTDDTLDIVNKYTNEFNLKTLKLNKNSGGPGKPRNKIIEQAQGEYLFFLDSDDYLDKDTLINAYEYAQEHNSDIVLVKMKGVNGRTVPKSMFKKTQAHVDLYKPSSNLMYNLNPLKLFKTCLLRENNLDFPVNLSSGEDQLFMIKAYILARKISVLADKDYYFATKHDGEHMTFTPVEPKPYYDTMKKTIESIYSLSEESSDKKDQLVALFLNRHFRGSRTANITIKDKDANEKSLWLDLLHDFIYSSIPTSVDKYLNPKYIALVVLARSNYMEKYGRYEVLKHDCEKNAIDIELLKKENNYLKNTLNRKSIKLTRKIADYISGLLN